MKGYAFTVCLLMPLAALAKPYTFTMINPFSAFESSARGVNNYGQIVGDFENVTEERGYLLRGKNFTKVTFPGSFDTDANGIDDHGVIVGTYAATAAGGGRGLDHGYVRDSHGFRALPDPPNNSNGFPDFNAINNEGDIVGVTGGTVTSTSAFLLSEGVYTLIDCPSGLSSEANGINDDQDIVGECREDLNNIEHGFLRHGGNVHVFDYPLATGTVALGINDEGVIVGTYTDANGDHGFLVEDLLGTPNWQTVDCPVAGPQDTKVFGINENGELVGQCFGKGFKATRPNG